MEHLTYSLWFMLIVWSLNVVSMCSSVAKYVKAHKGKEAWEYPEYPMSFMAEFHVYVLTPAPAILLEYLIVR
jgi:hypothetical protein